MDDGNTKPTPPGSGAIPAAQGQLLEVQQQFLRHQSALTAYALSLVPSLPDAQDLVQETFLIVSRKADSWTAGTSFMAWAATILRYQALHHLRASRVRDAKATWDLEAILEEDTVPDEDLLVKIQRLKECIQQLSPRAKQLILLRYHADMLPEAIALSVQWSTNSVRVALTRAKQSLRRCVESKNPGKEMR
jgi:RNA polymerase sigma-70 factor (ECF subfamily)